MRQTLGGMSMGSRVPGGLHCCSGKHAAVGPIALLSWQSCTSCAPAGHFKAAPSNQGRRLMASMAEEDNNSHEQAVWLVYKWEALQPLSHYAAAAQSPQGGLGIFARAGLWGNREDAAQTALHARCTMVRYHPGALPAYIVYGQFGWRRRSLAAYEPWGIAQNGSAS